MKIHELKTIQPFFDQLGPQQKNFEVRYNDRKIQRHDILVLSHWDGIQFTGKSKVANVCFALRLEQVPNFVLATPSNITYDMRLWEAFGLDFGDNMGYIMKRSEALKLAHKLAK